MLMMTSCIPNCHFGCLQVCCSMSRLINLLCALMLCKPALAISFHEKDDSLMTAMGLQEFRQDIANLDVSALIEQFVRLEQNADRLSQQIRRKTKGYRRELDKQYT